MQKDFWDPKVEHRNVIRIEIGEQQCDKLLPPVHPDLELFRLQDGHQAFPGLGVRAKNDIHGLETTVAFYAGIYLPVGFFDSPYK